jgi:hypothetical protein
LVLEPAIGDDGVQMPTREGRRVARPTDPLLVEPLQSEAGGDYEPIDTPIECLGHAGDQLHARGPSGADVKFRQRWGGTQFAFAEETVDPLRGPFIDGKCRRHASEPR